jgi:hypothetical protein
MDGVTSTVSEASTPTLSTPPDGRRIGWRTLALFAIAALAAAL